MRDRYLIYFCRKEQGEYSVLAKKRLKVAQKEVSFKKQAFVLDYERIMLRRGRTHILAVDVAGGQIAPVGAKDSVSSAFVQAVMIDKLGSQFVSGLASGLGKAWLDIVIGLCIGLPIGIIVGQYVSFGGA
jgi:hypothetical protein